MIAELSSLRSAGAHTDRMCKHQPTKPACKGKEKMAIHTLGTGMTSTWSHYNTREIDTQIQKQGEKRGRRTKKEGDKNKCPQR